MKKKILVLISILLIIFGTVHTVFATDSDELVKNSIAHLSEIGKFIAFTTGKDRDIDGHMVSAKYEHTGDTFIRDDEYDDTVLSREELPIWKAKLDNLLDNCTCIEDNWSKILRDCGWDEWYAKNAGITDKNTPFITHWGHPRCSLDNKWENLRNYCTHATQWEELFEKFAITKFNNTYYEFDCSWAQLKLDMEVWINKANQHYTISQLIDMLNSQNPNVILSHFPSVFCIKHNHPLYYKVNMSTYHGSKFLLDDYYTLDWTVYAEDGTASEKTTRPPTSDIFNWTANVGGIDNESLDQITNYSNTKFLHSRYMNLKAVESPLEGEKGVKYDLAYIVTFAEKVDGVTDAGYNIFDGDHINEYTTNYYNEIAQRAIWSNTGDKAEEFQDVDLYFASTAFDGYEYSRDEEKVILPDGTTKNGHGIDVTVTPYENAGTVIDSNNSTYQVGPFHMSDYSYAYCDYAVNLSGKVLTVDKGLFGGIIDAYVTLVDDSGKEYKFFINGDSLKVTYSGWDSSKGNDGGEKRSGTYWSAPFPSNSPNQTRSTHATGSASGYIYPWPNSDFYLEFDRDAKIKGFTGEIDDPTTINMSIDQLEERGLTLTGINFLYRWTTSEGNGWVCKSRVIKHTWKVAQTPSQTNCTYYCTDANCRRQGLTHDQRSDAGVTHKLHCLESTIQYCQYGYTEGNGTSHIGTSCDWYYKDTEHTHDDGCYSETEDGGSELSCGRSEHTHNDDCRVHDCDTIDEYCEHGYEDGDHSKTISYVFKNRTTAYNNCDGVTRCGSCNEEGVPNTSNAHYDNNAAGGRIGGDSNEHYGQTDKGHTTCYSSYWSDMNEGESGGSFTVTDGQPLLAIHDANVEVFDNGYGSTYNGASVRMTTDLRIDKYFVKVEHTGVTEATFDSVTERKDKTAQYKLDNFMKLERGDKVTFYIDLVNLQREQVKYWVRDYLPIYENCKISLYWKSNSGTTWALREISDHGDAWVLSNNNSLYAGVYGEIQGYSSYRLIVELKVTQQETLYDVTKDFNGLAYNFAKLMYQNCGPSTANNVLNWVRTSDSRTGVKNGPVVNVGEVNGYKVEDYEFFYIKSYHVPVDKYIVDVHHTTKQDPVSDGIVYERDELDWEDDNGAAGYNNIQKYYDRDVINDEDGYKKNNAIYLEYGDSITYKVDLQNTFYEDDGDTIERSDEPYYDPDGVKVALKDTLPVDKNGKVAIDTSTIIVEYYYKTSDNPDGDPVKYTFSNNIVTPITDWRYTDESNPNKTENGKITFNAKYEIKDGYIYFENFPVTERTESYFLITGIINTPEFKTKKNEIEYENKIEITSLQNLNNYEANNTSERTVSSDFFILNEYKAIIDNYVVKTDNKILKENSVNDFEELYTYQTDLDKDGDEIVTQKQASEEEVDDLEHNRSIQENKTSSRDETEEERRDVEEDRPVYPVPTEKYETITYQIRIDNRSKETITNTNNVYKDKYATQVRTSEIKYYLEEGLDINLNTTDNPNAITAIIYRADGTMLSPRVKNSAIGTEIIDGKKFNYVILSIADKAGDEYTTLNQNEHIIYTLTATVSRSNMYLHNLETKAVIHKLTNINNGDDSKATFVKEYPLSDLDKIARTREVTEQNTVRENQKYSSDFVKLKDLIIAGKVWLDLDKNGYIEVNNTDASIKNGDSSNITGNPDRVMEGIKVRLYSKNGTLIREVITDRNGLYTFASKENSNDKPYRTALEQRIPKATGRGSGKSGDYNTIINYTNSSTKLEFYIEYEYDGVLYKPTNSYSLDDNLDDNGALSGTLADGTLKYKVDSNANEFIAVREEFNKKYETISYNTAYPTNASGTNITHENGYINTFDKNGHNSYLNIDHNRKITSRSFITLDAEQKTNLLWLYDYNNNALYSDPKYENPETEYLKYINLGLQEREEIDISLTKDVYEVKTTINAEEMSYSFDRLESESGATILQNGKVNSSGKTYLQNYIIKAPYGMTLYETDFKYRVSQYQNKAVQDYKGKESELNVEVTYKINIDNDRITKDNHKLDSNGDYDDEKLYTTIHEITEFYDSNFINAFESETELKYKSEENIDGDLVSTKDSQNIKVKDDKVENKGKQEYNKTGDLKEKEIAVAQAWYLRKATEEEKSNDDIVKYKYTGERSVDGNYVREYLEIYKDSLYSDNVTMANFNTLYIRPKGERELKINEGENINIYIKYVLDKNATTDDLKIANERSISQINSYSVWYQKNNKPASIVDMDSNVGNIGKDYNEANTNLYEDTVYKTNIDIKAVNVENISGTKSDEIVMIRKMSGRVWDDARSEEITEKVLDDNGSEFSYTQYYGDGIYGEGTADESKVRINKNVETSYVGKNENEKDDLLVRNAKVEFIEIVKIKQPDGSYRYYEEKIANNDSVKQNTRTDENGNYTLYGFMPGYYIVRFTYGDTATGTGYANATTDMQLFNGHDYKSTQYTGVEDTETDSDAIILKMQEVNNSDAKDDEIRRLESIAYSETMVNEKAEILKGSANGKYITVRDARSDADLDEEQKIENTPEQLKALTENTYMYADTVTFYVKPEKLDWLTPVKTEAEAKDESKDVTYRDLKGPIIYDELTDLDFNHTKSNVRKNFDIENLDFGIEYRPESQISLSKEVSGVKLTTSDGKVLVKLALETMEKGKQEEQYHRIIEDKSVGIEYVQFISNIYGEYDTENKYINLQNLTSEKEDGQGFIFINVDDEILQGSTIEIEYSFTAENNSEIDRINNRLDNLRYRENGDNITNYANKFAYVKLDEDINVYNKLYADAEVNDDNKYVYTAAGTARNILYDEYYKDDENGDTYRTKTLTTYDLKEVELAGNNNAKSIVIDQQDEKVYYGRYLGKFYYLAADDENDLKIDNDVISSLKFDKILDYIDTDLVYSPAETGKEKNTLWTTATDADLLNVFVRYPKVTTGTTANSLLQNAKNVAYVTYNGDKPLTSNLVISVDDRLKDGDGTHVVNEELSKFLKPYYKTGDVANGKEADSIGKIKLTVSKVIGAESALNEDDMQYENLAEVIQFTAQTGRRTNYATTIGNAMVHKGEFSEATTEPDTSATELITLTPPTGLDRVNRVIRDVVETTGKGLGAGTIIIAVVFIGFVIVRFTIKKIRKRPIK